MRWRLFWTGVALLALLLGGFAAYLLIDESPPDDSDFQFTRTVAGEEANGFVVATQKVDVNFGWPGIAGFDNRTEHFDVPFGASFNVESARQAIASNPVLLRNFEESMRRPQFLAPENGGGRTSPGSLRAMAELGALRAGMLFAQGKERDGLAEALRVVRLGHRVEQAEGGLTIFLMGLGIKEKGSRLLAAMIQRASLPDVEMEDAIRDFEALAATEEDLRKSVLCEYKERSRMVKAMRPRGLKRYLFCPNETRRLLSERLRALLGFRRPWTLAEGAPGHLAGIAVGLVPWRLRNRTGKIFISIVDASQEMVIRSLGREQFWHQVPRLFIALKKFKRARGALPARLEDLVPEFIEKLPVDPFDGGTLKYSREEKLVRGAGGKAPLVQIKL